MLLKYKSDYQKIVFDLLSLLPNMGKLDRLDEEMAWYLDADNRNFYLWRDQYDNWSGLLGVEERPQNVVVRTLVLVPEAFNKQNCFTMLDELQRVYMGQKLIGALDTARICESWEHAKDA